jgi:hypothetical protein
MRKNSYANNPNAVPVNSEGKKLPGQIQYGYYYAENRGNIRGEAKNRDGYVAATLTFGYIIKGKNKYYKSKYKNIANRRKVVKKKTRAKF